MSQCATLQRLLGEQCRYKSANKEVGAQLDVAAQNFQVKDNQIKLPTLTSEYASISMQILLSFRIICQLGTIL